jgi:hypothetical protein
MVSATSPLAGRQFEAPDPDPIIERPSPGQPAPKADVPVRDDRFDALQREVDELRGANRELIHLVGNPRPATPAAPAKGGRHIPEELGEIDFEDEPDEDEPAPGDPEDPASMVDDISKLGAAALAKRGFVRASDVRKMIKEATGKLRADSVTVAQHVVNRARAEVTTESTIMRDFPDLANPDSDLFKATIPHVKEAAKLSGRAAKDPATLYLAAKLATAELKARGGHGGDDDRPRGGRRELDDDDDRSERDIRIASQQGDRGRSRSRVEADRDEEFVMNDDARSVAKAMGLTDDEYKKEATRVRVASTPRSRR